MSLLKDDTDPVVRIGKHKIKLAWIVSAIGLIVTFTAGWSASNATRNAREEDLARRVTAVEQGQAKADAEAKVRVEQDNARWTLLFQRLTRVETLMERQARP
jgi:hypothetical protein